MESNIQETLDEIQKAITELEEGNLSLEESFLVYEKGMGKIKNCQEMIDRIEKQMIMIHKEQE